MIMSSFPASHEDSYGTVDDIPNADVHATPDDAIAAATAATGDRVGIVMFVTADMSGDGFRWVAVDDPTSPIPDGWIKAVRSYEGTWLDFPSCIHAGDFLRVELAIVAAREGLLADTFASAGHVHHRPLSGAADWGRTLRALREEREALYATARPVSKRR